MTGPSSVWAAGSIASLDVPARTLILLPPSERKAPGGTGRPWTSGRMAVDLLDDRRAELLARIRTEQPVVEGPTRKAIDRYNGVLYRELDATSLDAEARRRLRRDVLIVSGLWGLVSPADPIPDYRLKMSARVEGIGPLARWWRDPVTEALAPRVRRTIVWDLLPSEHAAALDWRALEPFRRITVRFLDQRGQVVSHWNKLLKGSIVRWLVEGGGPEPEALSTFRHPQGYELDERATEIDGRHESLVMRERP